MLADGFCCTAAARTKCPVGACFSMPQAGLWESSMALLVIDGGEHYAAGGLHSACVAGDLAYDPPPALDISSSDKVITA